MAQNETQLLRSIAVNFCGGPLPAHESRYSLLRRIANCAEQGFSGGGGGGDALTTNPLSQFAATTSAQLAGVISDETGTGALVFANTPTLVTPVIGAATGSSLVLTKTTEQFRTGYDGSNYWTDTVASDGGRTIQGIGTTPQIRFNGSNAKATTASVEYPAIITSQDASNPLQLRLGIKTDSTDTNRYGSIQVEDNGTLRPLVLQDGGGNVSIGNARNVGRFSINGNGENPTLLIYDEAGPIRYTAETYSDSAGDETQFNLRRSRGTIATPLALQGDDEIGTIFFAGLNNEATGAFRAAATIRGYADGEFYTSSDSTDSPGRLEFGTCPDGSGTVECRLRIKNDGKISAGDDFNPSGRFDIRQPSTTAAIPVLTLDQKDISEEIVHIKGSASAGTAAQSLVSASDFTTPGAIIGWEKVAITDAGSRIGGGSKTVGYRPIYAIPTA